MADIDIDKKYNCHDCQKDRMHSMNCDGDRKKPTRHPVLPAVHWMFTYRCPRALIEEFPECTDLWEEYTTWKCLKVLPRDGGTDNQDARLVEAFKFISGLVNKIEMDSAYTKWRAKKNTPKEEQAEENKLRSFGDINRSRGKRR